MEIYSQKAARIYVRISLQMLSICKERHKSYTYTDCKQEWWQTSYVMEQLTVAAVNKAKTECNCCWLYAHFNTHQSYPTFILSMSWILSDTLWIDGIIISIFRKFLIIFHTDILYSWNWLKCTTKSQICFTFINLSIS